MTPVLFSVLVDGDLCPVGRRLTPGPRTAAGRPADPATARLRAQRRTGSAALQDAGGAPPEPPPGARRRRPATGATSYACPASPPDERRAAASWRVPRAIFG